MIAFNKEFPEYQWLFISLENCASKQNHTVATLENILEIVGGYPTLQLIVLSIFRAWLILFFPNLKVKVFTLLNK